jgi:hypothetical protein
VAQIVEAHRVAQPRVLERLLVPLLADHVARQRLGALGGQGAGDEGDQLLANAVALGDLALGQPAGDQVGGDCLPAGARRRGHRDRLGRGGAVAHEHARVALHRELL